MASRSAQTANLMAAIRQSQLGRRLLYTLGALVIFRLGANIPLPGVNTSVIQQLFTSGTTIFALLNLFSGGATATLSLFAMSIIPYINASIIMQLMTVVVPKVEEWSKEGEEGYRHITTYTRWGTLVLGLLQSGGVSYYLSHYKSPTTGLPAFTHPGIASVLLTTLLLTAGTMILMWIGEQITDKGIGNGISLLVFFGIISRVPFMLGQVGQYLSAGVISYGAMAVFVVAALVILAAVVYVNEGYRRIAIQYPKRVVGRRMYQGGTTHLPMRVNQAGVIPVIFAISLLLLPFTVAQFVHQSWQTWLTQYFGFVSWPYIVAEFLLVVVFTFFYTQVVFKPDDVADNLKKAGGFIPGIRPGKPTADFLARVSYRLTWAGALFLGLISVMPSFVVMAMKVNSLYFGGTSLLIIVGVALDTLKQIQSHIMMRNYQGFMR
jgi:preprotein translocase subunit SecY